MSQRTIAVPARALNYAHDHGFKLMSDGVEWPYDYGPMTVTVPRPRDYAGGGVTVRLCFKCTQDPGGDHEFKVAATAYDSGGAFAAHAFETTPLMDLPGVSDNVFTTSVDIPAVDGWGDGDWWYFKLDRHGMYRAHILMLSVGLDYEATSPLLPWRPSPIRKALTKAPKKKAPKAATKKVPTKKVPTKKVSTKARKALAKSWLAKR